ncbi:HD domain-containing protein [Candidatus Gracilibacteria bacterium]|nr:HD domain-containing protein [Candidatus Gracilibacteria bacterium]
MDINEARDEFLEEIKSQMDKEMSIWQSKFVENTKNEANILAMNIVADAIQRTDSEVSNEFTLSTVHLANDSVKGNIIGKEGRNIQFFEKTTGCELIIDETPNVVIISGYNSIRRHIAQKTLEKLLAHNKIHPGAIQEAYQLSLVEVENEIMKVGQSAVDELGIYEFPEGLVRLIGRLGFRTSYGQNVLKHSLEMAKLARIIAMDMNKYFGTRTNYVDVDICIKGALLHDIGKAVDEITIPRKNHITLGEKICNDFALDYRIKKCVTAQNISSNFGDNLVIEAAIVAVADKISASRIGARKQESAEYYQRLAKFEEITESVYGVNKSFVVKGGKELWVFFDTSKVNPAKLTEAVSIIANRLRDEAKVVGQLKIIGKWEGEVVEYLG